MAERIALKGGIAAMLALMMPASAGSAAEQRPLLPQKSSEPGRGVLCLWAFASAASEVGKHCPVEKDPEFQAALEEGIAQFDRYAAANAGMSAEMILKFKRDQGGLDMDTALLCSADIRPIYDLVRSAGAAAFRDEVRQAVSRPGEPTFGDCV